MADPLFVLTMVFFFLNATSYSFSLYRISSNVCINSYRYYWRRRSDFWATICPLKTSASFNFKSSRNFLFSSLSCKIRSRAWLKSRSLCSRFWLLIWLEMLSRFSILMRVPSGCLTVVRIPDSSFSICCNFYFEISEFWRDRKSSRRLDIISEERESILFFNLSLSTLTTAFRLATSSLEKARDYYSA